MTHSCVVTYPNKIFKSINMVHNLENCHNIYESQIKYPNTFRNFVTFIKWNETSQINVNNVGKCLML